MIKKSLLLFILFLCSVLIAGCVEEEKSTHTKGLEFELIENKNAYSVTNYTGDASEVYIDSTYNSLPVIRIETGAFLSLDHVTSIVLPDTIEELGKYCFQGTSLPNKITVPDKVYYFGSCYNNDTELHVSKNHLYHKEMEVDGVNVILTKDEKELIYVNKIKEKNQTFNIPSTVTKIGDFAMFYSDFDKIIVPNNVTEIGHGAFWHSDSEVNIPSKIKKIGAAAYLYCKLKGELILPEGLEEIGASAFGANELTSIVFPSSLKALDYSVFPNAPNYFNDNVITKITFNSWRLNEMSKSRFKFFILHNYRYTQILEITVVLPEDEAEADELKEYLEESLLYANTCGEKDWVNRTIKYE